MSLRFDTSDNSYMEIDRGTSMLRIGFYSKSADIWHLMAGCLLDAADVKALSIILHEEYKEMTKK